MDAPEILRSLLVKVGRNVGMPHLKGATPWGAAHGHDDDDHDGGHDDDDGDDDNHDHKDHDDAHDVICYLFW